jgi:hypothetical protein
MVPPLCVEAAEISTTPVPHLVAYSPLSNPYGASLTGFTVAVTAILSETIPVTSLESNA